MDVRKGGRHFSVKGGWHLRRKGASHLLRETSAYGIDDTNMTMASVPRGNVKGDTWTYTDEGMMGGQKMKSRMTIKELSPTSYTFAMDIQGPDGKWMPFMQSKSTKTK